MKRVYLDQNKWIDLTRARRGLPKGVRFRDALDVAIAAVETGLASFPLSDMHYIELSRRSNWKSRRELALTMALLSKYHTLGPVKTLIGHEIDVALASCFAVSARPRESQPFGLGTRHAFAASDLRYEVPAEIALDLQIKLQFEERANQIMEWALLTGPPRELESQIPGFDRSRLNEPAEKYACEKERLRDIRRAFGNYKGQHAEDIARAQTLVDYGPDLTEALHRVGLDWSNVFSLGKDGMTQLVEAIPIMWVDSELHRLRDIATQQKWEPNDLADVNVLTRAAVYCDIVVTERQWAGMLRSAGLDAGLATVVLNDLADLPAALV